MWDETRPGAWLWEQQIAEDVSWAWLVEAKVIMRSRGPSLLPQATARLLALPGVGQHGLQHSQVFARSATYPGQTMGWAPAQEITGPDITSSWHALNKLYDQMLGAPRRAVRGASLLWDVETHMTACLRTPSGWETVVVQKEVTLTESDWHMTMKGDSHSSGLNYMLYGRKGQDVDDALLPFFGMLFREEAPQAAVRDLAR